MGYAPVEHVAHALEDALGRLRADAADRRASSAPLLAAGLDALEDAVEACVSSGGVGEATEAGADVLGALRAHLDAPGNAVAAAADDRPAGRACRPRTLAVDVSALDRLLDLAGELAAVRERLARAAAHTGDATLARAVADVARVSHAVTDEVRTARLVAVGDLFAELPRVVRLAARATGKRVALETSGGDVVADRAVVDALAEPLTHLLRNAVDHGIEDAATRARAGKPAEGRVVVRAARQGNALVIWVEDDGRGVDRDAVLARARGRLAAADALAPGEAADDATLLACLALPGLTTAERVGRVSGRGVGVDAALARVRALGGALGVSSTPGRGTCFTLRMPLSWAVVPSLLVRERGAVYALPLAHVRGTRPCAAGDALVPPLAALLAVGLQVGPATTAPPAVTPPGEVVVVGTPDGRALEVAVDELVGTADCVLKPLAAPRGAFRVAAGATILDGGEVVLVLDVPALAGRRAAAARPR